MVVADTSQAPKPFVNDTLAHHLTVGDSFQLNCSVSYPVGIRVNLEWSVPNPQGIDVSVNDSMKLSYCIIISSPISKPR